MTSSLSSSSSLSSGRFNVAVGMLTLAAFAAYGFVLIYLRDFHPDKAAWIAASNNGAHFEAKLAHVHGNLLALLNVVTGFVLAKGVGHDALRKAAAAFSLVGLVMPVGILGEVLLSTSPIPVLIGAFSAVIGMVLTGLAALNSWR